MLIAVRAPLLLPNIFERGFCARLIDLCEKHGGAQSGFMREQEANTVAWSMRPWHLLFLGEESAQSMALSTRTSPP
jgi:hypothetical protein